MNAAPNALPAEATMTRGLAGVTAGRTAISSLAGELRYRGYSIESLAQASDFEDVAYLLLHGELATKKEHDAFVGRIRDSATSLDKTLVQSLTLLAQRQSSASPMDALRSGISILGQIQLDQTPGIHALLTRRPNGCSVKLHPYLLHGWTHLRIAQSHRGQTRRSLNRCLHD